MTNVYGNKKAQSVLEYAVLITAVAIAVSAMAVYIQRAMNVRLKIVQQELSDSRR